MLARHSVVSISNRQLHFTFCSLQAVYFSDQLCNSFSRHGKRVQAQSEFLV